MKTYKSAFLAVLFCLARTGLGFQPLPSTQCRTPTNNESQLPVRIKNSEVVSQRLYYDENGDRQRDVEMGVNTFLRASQSSFQNVESMTNQLLKTNPMIALLIFVGAGALVAYISGFFFLGGYIETWNPAENDSIPYWDEEILIIERATGN